MFRMVDRCNTENISIGFQKVSVRSILGSIYIQEIAGIGYMNYGYSFCTFQEVLISSLVLSWLFSWNASLI